MKYISKVSILPVLGMLFIACPDKPTVTPDPRQGPSWPTKRPYIANADIIEGVGAADPNPSIEIMRATAADILIEEISLQTAVTDSGYTETYLRRFNEYYTDLGKSSASRDALRFTMRKNLLKYITFAEEWQDPNTGIYWRYGWMSKLADEVNALESAKSQALQNAELLHEFQKDEFLTRLQNRIDTLESKRREQEEMIMKLIIEREQVN